MFSQYRNVFLSISLILVGAGALLSMSSSVADGGKASADTKAVILKKLRAARPDLNFTKVSASEMPGIYEVEFNGGGVVYSTSTADHFVVGEVYAVKPTGIVNLTERRKNGERAKSIAALKSSELIVYPPKGEVKASMYVFTDVDCGYCRLIHKEVPSLNEMGVSVKYLAFPRAGMGSMSYKKIASAWCADDKLAALDDLKAGKQIDIKVCDDNPVAKQYALGQKLGVTGTPAIVLESGELIPGYLKADELARRLKL